MIDTTKICEQCGNSFTKPRSDGWPAWSRRRFCSLDCKSASQRGKPTWNKGKTVPRESHFIPCRICREPTRYHGTDRNPLYGLVHCDNPECVEASRAIKNDRIAASMKQAIHEGRKKAGAWKNRGWESAEEAMLAPWFESIGWDSQYICRTGISERPRWFRLDFALPSERLFIEIDGSVHRHRSRQERDVRRTAILESLGWEGLHIPASEVLGDIEMVKQTILGWISERGHVQVKPPDN